MDAIDVLIEARAYIGKGWCQGNLAQTVDGQHTIGSGRDAAKWCAMGAIFRVALNNTLNASPVGAAERLLSRAVGGNYIAFNDAPGRTQFEVEEALDRAIALGLDEERAAIRSGS